ncbi:MAG: fibronectin type III [Monoraphidium minutum]|nr:MAG: fibronectin type III [Monoraphidium minutum]
MAKAAVVALALLALAVAVSAQPGARVFAETGCIERIPNPPTNLRGRAVNESAITISWDEPTGDACVDTFNWYIVKKGDPQPRTLRPQEKSAYSVTVANLKGDTEYIVHVASVNEAKGESKYATVIVRTRRERCGLFARRPGAVTDVKFRQTSPSYAFVSWLPPVEGCAHWYRIESYDPATGRRLTRNFSFEAGTTVRVKSNMRYDYRVTPVALLGGEGPTARASLNTQIARGL